MDLGMYVPSFLSSLSFMYKLERSLLMIVGSEEMFHLLRYK